MKRRWSYFKAHFPAGPQFLVKKIKAGESGSGRVPGV